MAVVLLIVMSIIVIALIVGLYQKNTNGVCTSHRRLDGKTALVTGGTAGMGLEIAKDLATRGARVIIACPFKEEGSDALKHIVGITGSRNVIFKLLDLGSLESVRKFAADILKTENRLDILVNNAGVGIPNDFVTEDGISFILQVNYFGHFLLDLLLLPLLKKTGTPSEPSRIVNTSSILHHIGKLDVDQLEKPCKPLMLYKIQKYGNSKFFFIPYSLELTRRLKDVDASVVVNNVDPGNVGTRIFDSAGKLQGIFVSALYNHLFKSPKEGAQTAIHVAVAEEAGDVSGGFYKDCVLTKANQSAYDLATANKLWEESVRLVKLSPNELKQCLS